MSLPMIKNGLKLYKKIFFNFIKNFTRRWRCHGGLSQIKFALRPWDGPVGCGPLFHFFRTQNSRLAIFFILKSFTCKLSIYSNCWKTLNKFFSSSLYKLAQPNHPSARFSSPNTSGAIHRPWLMTLFPLLLGVGQKFG